MNILDIARVLADDGFSSDPKDLIGRKFIFTHGNHFIGGTILSIEYDPDEGIKLYVTSSCFREVAIKNFRIAAGVWIARDGMGGWKKGSLTLL